MAIIATIKNFGRIENEVKNMKIKIVEGTVENLQQFEQTEDYIHANLIDKTYVPDAMEQLKNSVFPNIFSLQFINLERKVKTQTEII